MINLIFIFWSHYPWTMIHAFKIYNTATDAFEKPLLSILKRNFHSKKGSFSTLTVRSIPGILFIIFNLIPVFRNRMEHVHWLMDLLCYVRIKVQESEGINLILYARKMMFINNLVWYGIVDMSWVRIQVPIFKWYNYYKCFVASEAFL